ncbi:Putative GNAT domain, acyl-CoA N-acyltransferase [Septoria linicola]|uniref:GNAT domain, acyl-CoA N-acyltransferase n=1 Tax=Septoria linicola TaxID=215465 RepID=A0A9Q9EH54_9PEZI|nr:putative GNAT domain, acyl-CoA N-acyltransferase [Septoria linicola]USW51466.1 Putative GNAT domain, acyl-CoA N-acyltransferase [Septoria linicola]
MNITTDRLLLRPVTEADLEDFHRLQSDPQVTKWTKQGPNKTLQRSEQMLDDLLVLVNTSNFTEPTMIHAITVLPSSDLIGLVGTFRPREIGFSLHPDYWGKGYAQEATRAFCIWYQEQHPGQALFAKVNTKNDASVTCLTRCGFSPATQQEDTADEAYSNDQERQTWLLREG